MVPIPALPVPDAMALLALPLLLVAAYRDIAVRRISNLLVGALLLLGLARHAASGPTMLMLALGVASFVFLAAFILWHRGVLGGGDVKMLSAVAVLVPPSAVPDLLLAVAIAGGLLAACHLLLRRRIAPAGKSSGGELARVLRCEAWRICRGAPMPYGVAIATGTIFVLLHPGV